MLFSSRNFVAPHDLEIPARELLPAIFHSSCLSVTPATEHFRSDAQGLKIKPSYWECHKAIAPMEPTILGPLSLQIWPRELCRTNWSQNQLLRTKSWGSSFLFHGCSRRLLGKCFMQFVVIYEQCMQTHMYQPACASNWNTSNLGAHRRHACRGTFTDAP